MFQRPKFQLSELWRIILQLYRNFSQSSLCIFAATTDAVRIFLRRNQANLWARRSLWPCDAADPRAMRFLCLCRTCWLLFLQVESRDCVSGPTTQCRNYWSWMLKHTLNWMIDLAVFLLLCSTKKQYIDHSDQTTTKYSGFWVVNALWNFMHDLRGFGSGKRRKQASGHDHEEKNACNRTGRIARTNELTGHIYSDSKDRTKIWAPQDAATPLLTTPFTGHLKLQRESR